MAELSLALCGVCLQLITRTAGTGVLRKSFNVIVSHREIKAFTMLLLREQRLSLNLC